VIKVKEFGVVTKVCLHTRLRMKPTAKKITKSTIIGQQGIALIQRIVFDMGHVWYQLPGYEAGIDGLIELRNSITSEVHNAIIQVQSKATEGSFDGETASKFHFTCDGRDLEYWLNGNAPVILVVSRPKTNEAYWIDVKSYFQRAEVRAKGRIIFDKKKDIFDTSASNALWRMGISKDAGIYGPPDPMDELLWSNLLQVSRYSKSVFIAETEFETPEEVWARFRELGTRATPEWFIKESKLFSFRDLSAQPFRLVCDQGTVEQIESSHWALSQDLDLKRDFTRLLNSALREKLGRIAVRFDKGRGIFYFLPGKRNVNRAVSYRSMQQRSSREVVKVYRRSKSPESVSFVRHFAFEPQFIRIENEWFLQINPTYKFTFDGVRVDRFEADRLAGIKRLERNNAVLGQVVTWAGVLSATSEDLFDDQESLIEFGGLKQFRLPWTLNDADWLPKEEADPGLSLYRGSPLED
jgi:hypothetical protein